MCAVAVFLPSGLDGGVNPPPYAQGPRKGPLFLTPSSPSSLHSPALYRRHVASTDCCPCGCFRAWHLVLSNRRLGTSDPCRRNRRGAKLGCNRKLPRRILDCIWANAH